MKKNPQLPGRGGASMQTKLRIAHRWDHEAPHTEATGTLLQCQKLCLAHGA